MFLSKCRSKGHFFYENIKYAWESAEVNDTFMPGTVYESIKSAWESAEEFFLPENPLTIDGILVDVFPGDKITC